MGGLRKRTLSKKEKKVKEIKKFKKKKKEEQKNRRRRPIYNTDEEFIEASTLKRLYPQKRIGIEIKVCVIF